MYYFFFFFWGVMSKKRERETINKDKKGLSDYISGSAEHITKFLEVVSKLDDCKTLEDFVEARDNIGAALDMMNLKLTLLAASTMIAATK